MENLLGTAKGLEYFLSKFSTISAPPNFISALSNYHDVPLNAKEISLSCHVECDPICNVNWRRNGIPVDLNNEDDEFLKFYTIQNTELPADPANNQFKSIVSTLKWNTELFPGEQLDRYNDNANYTCFSTRNRFGPGVISTTEFRVECKS